MPGRAIIAGIALTTGFLFAQSTVKPEFEVASLKQLNESLPPGAQDLSFLGTAGKPFKIVGTRVTLTGTLKTFITAAYDVKDYQIQGLPPWAGTLRFTLTAQAPDEKQPTQEQVQAMTQSVLADRFQLKVHRDSKEMSVYHLVQVKNVATFKNASSEPFSWKLSRESNGMLRSKATGEPISDFVQLVGVSSDRPVIDKTGITGSIDYDILIYQKEGMTQDDISHAIIDAVKDQLGLKMEPAKDKVELIVIDRAASLSAN
jgi:uncharacterized protein (TIGR03435 family)